MRYAIVSDIHGNLPAWKAALLDIQSSGVDQIICLGDIVGYGPYPAETLAAVHQHVEHFVLGNHDAVVGGSLDPACFNPAAQAAIQWTKSQLDRRAVRFLNSLPHVLNSSLFTCVHGDLIAPEQFRYILRPNEALVNFNACETQLLFVGHSHVPGLFVLGQSGVAHWLEPLDFCLEEGKRYIVNAGSIGLPRDNDPRAGYCIFDTETQSVSFRRIPFDLEMFSHALKAAGLPTDPCCFLDVAREQSRKPLREMLEFRPPTEAPRRSGAVTVAQLEKTKRALTLWQLGFLLLLTVAVIAGTVMFRQLQNRETTPELFQIAAGGGDLLPMPTVNRECLADLPEAGGDINQENPLPQFFIDLADPVGQRLSIEAAEVSKQTVPALRLQSAELQFLELRSYAVPALAGMRFSVGVSIKSINVTSGYLELLLVQTLADGTEIPLERRLLTDLKNQNWTSRSVTMPKDKDGLTQPGTVRLVIRGEFAGELLLRQFSLLLREKH